MRRIAASSLGCGTVLLALASVHCSNTESESAANTTSGINALDCENVRGTFVNATDYPDGVVVFTCATAQTVALNGAALSGNGGYKARPRFGLNLLHVEGPSIIGNKADIAFVYGNYLAAGAPVPEAFAVRINPLGWVSADDQLHLPLVSGAPLDLSDVGTQILRDQGDLLTQFDGFTKDVSGATSNGWWGIDYSAGLTVDSLSYDPTNVAITVVPNATGLTINLTVPSFAGQFDWTASALDVDLGDTVTVSADSLNLSIDVGLTYVPADGNGNPATITAQLGDHHTSVQNLQIGSLALDSIPLIGGDIDHALSHGVELLINDFGDGLFSMVQSSVVPPIATSIQQFHLPSTVTLPANLGTLNFAETFDEGSFDGTGDQLAIGAAISPATTVLASPGSLAVDNSSSSFDSTSPFGVSLSLDYINQAFYAVWAQGGLKAQVLAGGPLGAGVTADAVMAEAKFPLLLLAKEDDSGLSLQQGELEITTTLHHVPQLGDVPVKVAVSVIADANIALNPNNDALTFSLDAQNSTGVIDIVSFSGLAQTEADQITNIVSTLIPAAIQAAAIKLAPPPIPLPTVELGKISPAFAGRTGAFSGNLTFDGPTQRVYVTGDLITK